MKIKQRKDGTIVVDGEGMSVPVNGDIPTMGSPVMLTNFNFIGQPSTTVGHIRVSTEVKMGFPIRISVLDESSYGQNENKMYCPGDICTVADARLLIAAIEDAIQFVELKENEI